MRYKIIIRGSWTLTEINRDPPTNWREGRFNEVKLEFIYTHEKERYIVERTSLNIWRCFLIENALEQLWYKYIEGQIAAHYAHFLKATYSLQIFVALWLIYNTKVNIDSISLHLIKPSYEDLPESQDHRRHFQGYESHRHFVKQRYSCSFDNRQSIWTGVRNKEHAGRRLFTVIST